VNGISGKTDINSITIHSLIHHAHMQEEASLYPLKWTETTSCSEDSKLVVYKKSDGELR
jgi:hypothetical protein